MDWVLSVSFGELMLKGKNRRIFEKQMISQIRKAMGEIRFNKFFMEQGKLYIDADQADFEEIIKRVKKVFGIVYISPCLMIDKDMESIEKAVIEVVKNKNIEGPVTFKAKANRVDKSFPLKSPEIAAEVGAIVLKNFDNYKVDIRTPEEMVYVDIREHAFVYVDRYKGMGGLPIGTGGKALLLLSGGIDSPVAGFEIARRGVDISAMHFHSYPFTSERAEDKVKRLAETLAIYVGEMTFYSINLLPIYTAINKNCKPRFTTVIARRFMMRIGEEIARKDGFDGFVTGESLGQVASQTIQGISVVNAATNLPILRPLINMDKVDIIEVAKDINTYDISIEPFDDCCTFFAPDRPATKPRIYDVEREEENLDIDSLVKEAIDSMEVIKIRL